MVVGRREASQAFDSAHSKEVIEQPDTAAGRRTDANQMDFASLISVLRTHAAIVSPMPTCHVRIFVTITQLIDRTQTSVCHSHSQQCAPRLPLLHQQQHTEARSGPRAAGMP